VLWWTTIVISKHLTRSAAKLKICNDLIAELTGTWRDASTSTVCSSALAVCYTVCCPVWARSSYARLIDTRCHSFMRLISGCLPQVSWLLLLASVMLLSLLCKAATDVLLQTIEVHPNWPVFADVFEHPPLQLAFLCPVWSDMSLVNITVQWKEDWSSASVVNHTMVTGSVVLIPLVTCALCLTTVSQVEAHVMQTCTSRVVPD